MVIVMQEGATDAQIQHVIDRLVASGFNVHRSTGESHTVLGAVGVHPDFDHRDFELPDAVRAVMRITHPLKLAPRGVKPAPTLSPPAPPLTTTPNHVFPPPSPSS